jgi:hypothetical protein
MDTADFVLEKFGLLERSDVKKTITQAIEKIEKIIIEE